MRAIKLMPNSSEIRQDLRLIFGPSRQVRGSACGKPDRASTGSILAVRCEGYPWLLLMQRRYEKAEQEYQDLFDWAFAKNSDWGCVWLIKVSLRLHWRYSHEWLRISHRLYADVVRDDKERTGQPRRGA